MAASTSFLNATLAGTAGGITLFAYAGVGNSSPGTTGAGEISGGTYARQACSTAWAAPASASSATNTALSWAIPASTTGIDWIQLWSALTAGTYQTDLVLGTAVSFSSAGTLTAASGALTYTAAQAALNAKDASMSLTKVPYGEKPDGSPKFLYTYDGPEDGGPIPGTIALSDGTVYNVTPEVGGVLLTGPISGTVVLSDGTVYNVTPEAIEHAPGHAGPICHHIDKMHEASGALSVKHTCTDFCGAEADSAT